MVKYSICLGGTAKQNALFSGKKTKKHALKNALMPLISRIGLGYILRIGQHAINLNRVYIWRVHIIDFPKEKIVLYFQQKIITIPAPAKCFNHKTKGGVEKCWHNPYLQKEIS